MTVNELLSLTKIVRERLNELKHLRNTVSVKDTYMYGDKERTTEPQYDVKAVDKKIVFLENFLYKSDAKIKTSNAKTEVLGLEINVDELLEPLV